MPYRVNVQTGYCYLIYSCGWNQSCRRLRLTVLLFTKRMTSLTSSRARHWLRMLKVVGAGCQVQIVTFRVASCLAK